ncbi:hypothetical protein BP6252_10981 [Coleophoma cylindrospora]|uniref:PEBP-like protein n=1 Tax=Coleophoma cylindrospora TaxID=1849047 RepID=A0A3D8QNM6_9HELO|nr:hypothetical protein BP6252_10981 [Coleophoma cylindrospora]
MHASVLLSAVLATAVLAQTPNTTVPATTKTLNLDYNGTVITPGVLLPSTAVATQPDVYAGADSQADLKYMIFMLDLTIPDSDVTSDVTQYSTLVEGLGANRTTRLHWWGGNYTLSSDGTFVNSSDCLAEYTSPRPRQGDIAHTYTLYLFNQPANYTPPEEALNGSLYDQTSESRFNFSLTDVADIVGGPLAANYFTSEYTNSTS